MALGLLRGALGLGAFLLGAQLCCAASLAAAGAPEAASMLAWGAAHADCAEWTDACQVCARAPDGKPQCSTPGIACVPGPIACSRGAAPAGASPRR